MHAELRAITVDPVHDERWRRLTDGAGSSLFTSPEWMGAIADTYGFGFEARIVVGAEDRPAAGFAYCHLDDAAGHRVVSLPFCDYADPMETDVDTWATLVDPVLELGVRVDLRCLHAASPRADSRFALRREALWHAIDLAGDAESLWAGLASGARQAVRRARDHGVTVRPGSRPGDLRSFYELHLGVRKHKYRLLPQPYGFMEAIASRFGDRLHLMLAEVDGAPVAGVLFIAHGDTLYYKFNASAAGTLELRPNDILAWEGMRLGNELGLARFDFGISEADQPGLVRYKRKYASHERPIALLRAAAAVEDVAGNELLGSLGAVTELLTRADVPDPVTEAAGVALYRYFA